jgi:hypothetical protein
MDCWRKGLELNPNDLRAKGYLVRELVARARLLADAGALEDARDACREALAHTADQRQEPLRQLHGEAERLLKIIAEAESQQPSFGKRKDDEPPA